MVLDRFITLLGDVPEVAAVVAEAGDRPAELHVTTFLDALTESAQRSVYAAERTLIDEFPDRTFDFHARVFEIVDGKRRLPETQFCLLLWRRGGADADAR